LNEALTKHLRWRRLDEEKHRRDADCVHEIIERLYAAVPLPGRKKWKISEMTAQIKRIWMRKPAV
jgi:hypothetical protein